MIKLFKQLNEKINKFLIKNKKFISNVNTLTDLYKLHESTDLYIGKQIYVNKEKQTFILISNKFNDNINKCWIDINTYKDKKINIFKRKIRLNLDGITLKDINGNEIDYKKNKNLKIFIVEGNNFINKGIHNGDYICIDTKKKPEVNDIIMDYNSIIWNVSEIIDKKNFKKYVLERNNNIKVIGNDGIYGTVLYNLVIEKKEG